LDVEIGAGIGRDFALVLGQGVGVASANVSSSKLGAEVRIGVKVVSGDFLGGVVELF
jgi:hypothetical protein